jgi:hypothetical protein
MPRDGTETYVLPFPDVEEDTTIESAVYNGFTNDVAQDLNTPRPILHGGTGATSADGALDNLSAEKFKQVVTNWDTMTWRAGSFYALSSALGAAPISGHAFAGISYYANATDFVCEATDVADPANPDKYIRVMAAGVWGNWTRVIPATSASNLGEYTFDNQTTFPPASGTIRFNDATQNAATELFISHLNPAGGDNSSQITLYLVTGVDIVVQDKDEGSKYKVFTATAAPVLSGGDYRVTVTLKLAGTDIVNSQRVAISASGEAQRASQRQLIYAAPFDALAYNGMQINSAMEVSQQYGATAVPLGSLYVLDGWSAAASGGTVTAQQVSGGPLGTGAWFNNFLATIASVAVPSVAGTYAYTNQSIEGYRTARLGWGYPNAQPVTIAFWIYSSLGGTMAVTARNYSATRTYVVDVPVTAATWQYKTVTIPGCADGTWDRNHITGMTIFFTYAGGSTFQTAANVWVTGGNYLATPATTNLLGSNGASVYLTGVVVLPGIEAPSAARSALIMRPYDQELVTCRRYWWCSNPDYPKGGAIGMLAGYPATPTSIGCSTWRLTVPMRATPGVSLWSNGVPNNVRNVATGAAVSAPLAGAIIALEGGSLLSLSSPVAGAWYDFDMTADARL